MSCDENRSQQKKKDFLFLPGKNPASERQLQLSQRKTSLARTQPTRDSYNSANEKPAWQEPSQWKAVTTQPMKAFVLQTLNSSKGPFVYSSPANFLCSSLKELSLKEFCWGFACGSPCANTELQFLLIPNKPSPPLFFPGGKIGSLFVLGQHFSELNQRVFFFFNRGIIALQCCVCFYHTSRGISHQYTYIYF